MPSRIPTRCSHPDCPATVRGQRFCDQHRGTASRWSDQRRGTAAERGYDHDWAQVADERRRLDDHLCQPCLNEQRLTASRTVDHIVPVHVRPDWRLEINNTQVLCDGCHRAKTNADTRRYGSSTAVVLHSDQQRARNAAWQLPAPPRSDSS
jgi:5-methylcytosine-specific restriction protein A